MRDAGPLRPFLDSGVVVLDGGLATELERRGADLRDALWSGKVLLEAPEAVVEVHHAYFEAGADIAITASYQASEQGFSARGIDAEGSAALLRRSVDLAREARDRWLDERVGDDRRCPLVAASVGPYGAVLADGSEYRGDYGVSLETLTTFHATRLEPLVQAGPDLLAIETIPSAIEAQAIVDALTDLGDPLPAWCSFTLRDGMHLADGGALDEAVRVMAGSASVAAIGVNCSAPDAAVLAAGHLAEMAWVPIVAYPNRGADWDPDTKSWAGGDDVDMAMVATELVLAGATIVGGCCGTGPADVRAIAAAVGARPSASHD